MFKSCVRYFNGRTTPALLVAGFAVFALFSAVARGWEIPKHEDPGGWYFYRDPSEDGKKPEGQEEKTDIKLPTPVIPPPLSSKYGVEELMHMHPVQLKELMTLYHQKKVWEPSVENARDYNTLKLVMLKKSNAAAAADMFVVQTEPGFGLEGDYPLTQAGHVLYDRRRYAEVADRIRGEARNFSVLFFKRAGCAACLQEEIVVSRFVTEFGMEVRGVQIEKEPGLAAMFGVGEGTTTPYMLLVGPLDKPPFFITDHFMVIDDLTAQVYNGILYLRGETKPSQWGIYGYEKGTAADPDAAPAMRSVKEEALK